MTQTGILFPSSGNMYSEFSDIWREQIPGTALPALRNSATTRVTKGIALARQVHAHTFFEVDRILLI